jgi:hypothetical protein
MSFRKPQFGPQNIGDLLEAIFACNGIEGPDRCGSREERTDTPKVGAPFKVCTVTFPADVVGYAEQRDFRIDRPDGSVYLYGKAVNRRKVELEEARRAIRALEAEAKAKADAEAAEACTDAAPGAAGQHDDNVYPVNSMMVQAAIEAAYAAGRTVTIPSVPVQPSDVEAEEVIMAPYPEELVALIDIAPGVTSPRRWTPEGFGLLSKGQRQRWIRKLKGFCAHLKAHLPPLAMSALEAAEAGEEAKGARGGVAAAPEAGDIAGANEYAHDAPEAAMDITWQRRLHRQTRLSTHLPHALPF